MAGCRLSGLTNESCVEGQRLVQPGQILLGDFHPLLTDRGLAALLEGAADAGVINACVVTVGGALAEE